MSLSSIVLETWKKGGYIPPIIPFLFFNQDIYLIIDDSSHIYRLIDRYGHLYLTLDQECEQQRDRYICRHIYRFNEFLTLKDQYVLNTIGPLVFTGEDLFS